MNLLLCILAVVWGTGDLPQDGQWEGAAPQDSGLSGRLILGEFKRGLNTSWRVCFAEGVGRQSRFWQDAIQFSRMRGPEGHVNPRGRGFYRMRGPEMPNTTKCRFWRRCGDAGSTECAARRAALTRGTRVLRNFYERD